MLTKPFYFLKLMYCISCYLLATRHESNYHTRIRLRLSTMYNIYLNIKRNG